MKKFIIFVFLLVNSGFLMSTPSFNSKIEVIDMDTSNFRQITKSNEYVIIFMYSDFCPDCKNFAPIFALLNDALGNNFAFAKVNAPKEVKIAKFFNVTEYPTVIFVKKDIEIGQKTGYMNKMQFIAEIDTYFGSKK